MNFCDSVHCHLTDGCMLFTRGRSEATAAAGVHLRMSLEESSWWLSAGAVIAQQQCFVEDTLGCGEQRAELGSTGGGK